MEHSEKRVYRDGRWRLNVGEKKRVISRSTQFDKEDKLVIYFLHKPQIQEKWFRLKSNVNNCI